MPHGYLQKLDLSSILGGQLYFILDRMFITLVMISIFSTVILEEFQTLIPYGCQEVLQGTAIL